MSSPKFRVGETAIFLGGKAVVSNGAPLPTGQSVTITGIYTHETVPGLRQANRLVQIGYYYSLAGWSCNVHEDTLRPLPPDEQQQKFRDQLKPAPLDFDAILDGIRTAEPLLTEETVRNLFPPVSRLWAEQSLCC